MKEFALRGDRRIKYASVDPGEWLLSHQQQEVCAVDASTPEWLTVGADALALHGGCVVSAISNSPDLQVEIILAHILECDGVPDQVRERIFALAESVGR